MRLYRWKGASDSKLVAVLSYSFPNANPPRCCRALGKVVLFSSKLDSVLDTFEKVPYAFTTFTSVRFLDVDGTGNEKLIIAGDLSGVATIGIDWAVFDLSQRKLIPVISVTSVILYEADLDEADVHTLTLDERQTLASKGKKYYFVKKAYVDNGKVLRTPATSRVSLPVGTGVPLSWQ